MVDDFIMGAVVFGQNAWGVVSRPYETYRRLTKQPRYSELLYLGLVLVLYFAAASLVKTASFRPFLLTRQFMALLLGALGGYGLSVGIFYLVGRIVGGKGSLKSLIVGWGYTLLPTVMWFLATSLLYVVLPPPRTQSAAGILFSIVYLAFSLMMLAWKLTLAYLTLRFGLKLDLARIGLVALIALCAWGAYSAGMYSLGVFRIPFL